MAMVSDHRAIIQTQIQNRVELLSEQELTKLLALLDIVFPAAANKSENRLGTMPDLIAYMAEDFNDPLEAFQDYQPD